MDWLDVEQRVYEATRQTLTELGQAHPDETFYGCALYTDSGAMTVCVAVNSTAGLQRKLAQEVDDDDLQTAAYYTWCSSEWVYEGCGGEHFMDINRQVRDALEHAPFEPFKRRLVQAMTGVLKRLAEEGFFQRADAFEGAVLFVTSTDDDQAEAIELASAEQLNDPGVFAAFVDRYAV